MATVSLAEELGFDFSQEPCEEFLWRKWPCRKCLPCLHRRQQEWIARLTEHLRQFENNYFVTLTYNDENVPADENGLMCFDSKRIIKLHRDIRKRYQTGRFRLPPVSDIYDLPEYLELPLNQKISYYVTSEYCPTSTHRPHYHAVYYNTGVDQSTFELLIRSLWPDGFITVYPAYEGAAGYISKYLVKDVLEEKSYLDEFQASPISIMSKGLGVSYVQRMYEYHNQDPYNRQYYQFHGEKKVLGRYYKKKLFSDEVRERNAEVFERNTMDLRGKYDSLRLEHPAKFMRLLKERQKYFDDMRYAERWNMLKKQTLK